MPAKPAWIPKLAPIIHQLRATPRPFLDRADIELLLGVGRRRAQQILAQCTTGCVARSNIVDSESLAGYLEQLQRGEPAYYERRRRRKVASLLEQWQSQPSLRVEAPAGIVHRQLDGLPAGVRLEPGRIQVDFEEPGEALEKLLALAMAISNDFDGFHRRTVLANANQPEPVSWKIEPPSRHHLQP